MNNTRYFHMGTTNSQMTHDNYQQMETYVNAFILNVLI